MPTNSRHDFVGIITSGEASASAWELALADRMSEEVEIVLVESHELADPASMSNKGLYILRSPTDSVLRTLEEIGAEVILVRDSSETSWPENWIILPFASSPSNVAKVANLFLRNRALSQLTFLPETKIDFATYSHGYSVWENVQRFSSSLDEMNTLPKRLKASARLLDDSLCGAHVVQTGLRDDDGEYSLVAAHGHSPSLVKANRSFVAELERSGNLVIDALAGGEVRSQLTRYNAELIVTVRGRESLFGWFLLAVEDYHQVFLNKPLAERIARHVGALVDGQEQIQELASFKHAICEGLDQVETGISILNKKGIALVENKAAREVSRRLGCRSAHLIPEVHTAIQKAKFGHPTETFLDNYAVRTSSWGSLNNGCVLQTRQHIAHEVRSVMALDAWIKECQTTARSVGLEINQGTGDWGPVMIAVPGKLSIESVCQFLLDENLSRKIVVGYEALARTIRLHFDQEFGESFTPQPETLRSPPPGVVIAYASLGRRLIIDLSLIEQAVTDYAPAIGETPKNAEDALPTVELSSFLDSLLIKVEAETPSGTAALLPKGQISLRDSENIRRCADAAKSNNAKKLKIRFQPDGRTGRAALFFDTPLAKTESPLDANISQAVEFEIALI
jgi:hypothetical protein